MQIEFKVAIAEPQGQASQQVIKLGHCSQSNLAPIGPPIGPTLCSPKLKRVAFDWADNQIRLAIALDRMLGDAFH